MSPLVVALEWPSPERTQNIHEPPSLHFLHRSSSLVSKMRLPLALFSSASFCIFLPHPGRNKWEGKAFACAQERHPWELCIESCSLEDACTPLFPPVCFSKAGMLLAVLLSLQPSTDFLASACWVGEAKGWNASLAPRKCESQWGNGYI